MLDYGGLQLTLPCRLSSSLGNFEVHCKVVNYICQLANHISEFVLFSFFAKAKQLLALSGIL